MVVATLPSFKRRFYIQFLFQSVFLPAAKNKWIGEEVIERLIQIPGLWSLQWAVNLGKIIIKSNSDFTKKEHIDRELILAKINYSTKDKERVEGILNKYIGKIVYHKADIAIIEAVGDQYQIKSLLEQLEKFGIKELVKTGKLAISN